MKFLFDNNLSPHLARGLAEFSKTDVRVTQIVPLRDRFAQNAKDEVWLPELANDGGWAIVSIDQFKKTTAERELVRKHGLMVFVLDKQWSGKPFWEMSAQLVQWWPTILDVAALTSKAAYRVPYRRQGQKTLEQIRA
ncbi:hypothetical protein [uncultured Sphaerotilus sp.]|uniref:PIN-like domain-containing protein n=1 Tax=uncultured Sphaerotilus sp. TaxID=474984 RepID=UPI0030CA45EB